MFLASNICAVKSATVAERNDWFDLDVRGACACMGIFAIRRGQSAGRGRAEKKKKEEKLTHPTEKK